MDTALSIEQVTKRYATHLALDDVSFSVPAQSIFGLLGPNGAGKTTLIRIINQIIQADSGTIRVLGETLQEKHIAQIGYLPEERGLYKKMKVGDQLVYLAQLKGLSRREAIDRSKSWMHKFDILHWQNKKVEDLSKGMAQKVQFISTVMHQPKVIVLDEPFSGFDPVNAQLITSEILELKKNGSTIVFSTHRMETVEALCDHVALIHRAKKILEGPKKQIKGQYRNNTYIIEHLGPLAITPGHWERVSEKALEDHVYETVFRLTGPSSPNELIRELSLTTAILKFYEHIPSINDIFIQLVSDGPAPMTGANPDKT